MNALRRLRLQPLLSAAPTKLAAPKPNDLEANSIVTPTSAAQEAEPVEEIFNPPKIGTCPKCGVYSYPTDEYRTECFHCGTNYCWACGIPLEEEEAECILHLQWWNVFGCQGLDKPERVGHRAWDVCALQFVMGAFAGVPALLVGLCLGIATFAFWPCVVFGKIPRKHAFLVTVSVTGSILLLVIFPVSVLAMLPFYPIGWGYRRCFPSEVPVKDWAW